MLDRNFKLQGNFNILKAELSTINVNVDGHLLISATVTAERR